MTPCGKILPEEIVVVKGFGGVLIILVKIMPNKKALNFWVKLVLAPFLCTFAPILFVMCLVWVRVFNKRLPDFLWLE